MKLKKILKENDYTADVPFTETKTDIIFQDINQFIRWVGFDPDDCEIETKPSYCYIKYKSELLFWNFTRKNNVFIIPKSKFFYCDKYMVNDGKHDNLLDIDYITLNTKSAICSFNYFMEHKNELVAIIYAYLEYKESVKNLAKYVQKQMNSFAKKFAITIE